MQLNSNKSAEKIGKSGVWLIVLAATLWGTAGIYVRGLKHFHISNMMTVFLRAAFTFLILLSIILIKNRSALRIKIRDLWLFACTGIFSIVLFNFCYYKTMSLSTLSVAAVLLYTAPFFVMFISVPLFKEKFTLKKIGACLIAFVGCVLVSGVTGHGVRLTPACLGFGLMTGFGYALYTVFGELLLRRGYPSLTITFYTFVFALVGTLPFVFKDLIQLALTPAAIIPLGAVPVAIAMALFNTVFPYLLYTGGLKTVAPDRAPIIATVEPVVATLVGLVIFSEYPSVAGWIGIVLVIFAVIFLNLETGKKHETESVCKTESDA